MLSQLRFLLLQSTLSNVDDAQSLRDKIAWREESREIDPNQKNIFWISERIRNVFASLLSLLDLCFRSVFLSDSALAAPTAPFSKI